MTFLISEFQLKGMRADLIGRDSEGRVVIVEVKSTEDEREKASEQLLEYRNKLLSILEKLFPNLGIMETRIRLLFIYPKNGTMYYEGIIL